VRARVTSLWRHPVKGHGVEAVEVASFVAGRTMPWDRRWAIARAASGVPARPSGWVSCANFSRGATSPALMAIRARTDAAAGRITLSHPEAGSLVVDPDDPDDAARLVAWVAPLSDPGRARPVRVVKAADAGLTDSSFPSVAILNVASLAALSRETGVPLAQERFRGNIWLEDLEAWMEFDTVGRDIRIGQARFAIRKRITRCMATAANPETGRIDADTLGALARRWDHRDFGVYGEVIEGGRVAVGDMAVVA
jgi:uncharacterized protein